MGFASVAAVAVLMVAGLASFATYQIHHDAAADQREVARAEADERRSDLMATTYVITGNNYIGGLDELYLDLTNTGGTTIDLNELEVLIDGVRQTDAIVYTRIGGQDVRYWAPLEDLEIHLDPITSAPSRAAVVTEHGYAAYREL